MSSPNHDLQKELMDERIKKDMQKPYDWTVEGKEIKPAVYQVRNMIYVGDKK